MTEVSTPERWPQTVAIEPRTHMRIREIPALTGALLFCGGLLGTLPGCSKSVTNEQPAPKRQSLVAPQLPVSAQVQQAPYTEPTRERPAASGSGSFRLKFGWPKNMHARVVSTRRRVSNNGAPVEAQVAWAFRAQADDTGWRIDLESAQLERLSGRFEEEVLDGALVFQNVLPSIRVGLKGEFGGLVDYSRSRETIRSCVATALPATVDKARAAQLLDTFLDERRVELTASNTWSALVSSAIGQVLAVDKVYKNASEVPIPATGALVAFDGEVRVRGPLPCFVGDQQPRCVWIEMDSKPNAKALSVAVSQAQTSVAIPGKPQIRFVNARYRTEAVLETDRLVPHWFHLTQTNDLSVMQEGKELAVHQVHDRTDSFHYPMEP